MQQNHPDAPLLPHRLSVLGEAMGTVAQHVWTALDDKLAPTIPVPDMLATVARILAMLDAQIQLVSVRTNDLMPEVIANQTASDLAVYRAVGRFEASVRELLAGYHQVLSLAAFGDGVIARNLLAAAYRHTLNEIHDWLCEVVFTIADPLAAIQRRGLPTSGHVELPLTLTLTPAPELDELAKWAAQHSARRTPRPSPRTPAASVTTRPAQPKSPGFWDTLTTAILLCGISNALFGSDADDCDV